MEPLCRYFFADGSVFDASVDERTMQVNLSNFAPDDSDAYEKFMTYCQRIYGIASNNRNSAFLRPPNRDRRIKGLYFAGGSTHPGGGVPLAIQSGKIAAELIIENELNCYHRSNSLPISPV